MLVPKFLGQIYLNFKPETRERKRYRERGEEKRGLRSRAVKLAGWSERRQSPL